MRRDWLFFWVKSEIQRFSKVIGLEWDLMNTEFQAPSIDNIFELNGGWSRGLERTLLIPTKVTFGINDVLFRDNLNFTHLKIMIRIFDGFE